MSTSTLIIILIILLLILIPLLLSYIVYPDEKVQKNVPITRSTKKLEIRKNEVLSFEEIAAILGNKNSSKTDLVEAIEQLIRHHGKIHAKLGDLPHPDYKRYLTLIINLCKNPQADKNLIISLDQKLRIKNPRYGLDIDDAVNKGIAARGF
ncbi:hypothetical protein JHD50_12015 [Sulfurimonas sp. MAG313]|nr:hypothetical protein [Sulfurimonas sp. MAG313]MDF1882015.1 hypothetical protein [Sulfurimonas sp. MAG313]